MNTQTTTTANQFESTYAMLVRSEKEERSAPEIFVYGLLILTAVAAMWQHAVQPVIVPTNLVRSVSATQVAEVAQPAA